MSRCVFLNDDEVPSRDSPHENGATNSSSDRGLSLEGTSTLFLEQGSCFL